MHSYICIIAPHLGTIDEPREGRDIGTEYEDDVWWTHSRRGKEPGVHALTGILAKQVSSN